MKTIGHFLFGTVFLLLGTSAFSQTYTVSMWGSVLGCAPNSTVNIVSVLGTTPAIDIDVPLDQTCGFFIELSVTSLFCAFNVSTTCNGAFQSDTISTFIDPAFPDSNHVSIQLNCGWNGPDCENVVGGTSIPGSFCDDGDPNTNGERWSVDCECISGEPVSCLACFTIAQATDVSNTLIPFTAELTGCSSGGTSTFIYEWSLDLGVTFQQGSADTTIVFNEGVHPICYRITDTNNCTSTVCDSLSVDSLGNVQTGPTMCSAGFWVIQAFQNVDTTGGNPGGVEPIPNEVWIWNLSSGTGNFQFIWDFGDGSTSTEAFPTHIYATGGPYVLCLTTTTDSGCTDTFCDTLSIDADGFLEGMIVDGNNHGHGNNDDRSGFTLHVIQELPTAIHEHETLDEIELWPNPVLGSITLSLLSSRNSKLELGIIDLNGRVVSTTSNGVHSGNNSVTLPVDELESGMYIIRISDGTTTVSRRFVKQ